MSEQSHSENLSEQVNRLISQQLEEWPLAMQNYAALSSVQTRWIDFGDFRFCLQFNSERIRSSAAKVDAKSVSERPCFLCEKNRPGEQKSVDYKGKYSILINPFPIFKRHLTIALNRHIPQEIEPHFADMLDMAKDLPEFTLFYNGPKCGASAPDHFHFQAIGKRQLPVESEVSSLPPSFKESLIEKENLSVQGIGKNYLRKVLVFSGKTKSELLDTFYQTLAVLKERGQEGEPMMNILAKFDNDVWTVFLFPRDKQRPSQFFAKGESQILMSPASAEMAGFVVLPREHDFEKMGQEDLIDIYKQVSINDRDFEILVDKLRKSNE